MRGKMDYRLTNAVWELTMKCNMRCQHCGSSCEDAKEDELTTEEALALCDDLKDIGLSFITLSGGELTTRKDWPHIAKRLVENQIYTSIITNGWNLSDETIKLAIEIGINSIAISIDGCKDTHDKIRMPGSFDRDITNLKKIKENNITPAVITTVQRQNIQELEELYECFKSIGVLTWQLQIALPMGNFKQHMPDCLQPEEIQTIIDFAYSKIDDDLVIDPADCIGYYTKKDIALKKKRFNSNYFWKGCTAGKYSIGILNNGDIVGCTSIRAKKFIEGNIRHQKLRDIWNSKDSFLWNRSFKKENLKGNCRECQYGDYCLGGCTNLRYCMNGDINSDNTYCTYSLEVNEYKRKIKDMNSREEVEALLNYMIEKKQYQIAYIVIQHLKELSSGNECENEKLHEIEAFLCFFMKDYDACKRINEAILDRHPNNKYAKKGLGLAIYELGEIDEGISIMYEALDKDYPDSYTDLYAMFKNQHRDQEAEALIQERKRLEKLVISN